MLPLPSSGQCHYAVAFSADGRWLAAGGSACAVDVWDLHSPQQPARRLEEMGEPIVRVRFMPDDQLLTHGMNHHRYDDSRAWAAGVFRLPGELLAGGAQTNNFLDYLERCDPVSGRLIDRMHITPRPLRVAYSADGEFAATIANGNLSVWDLSTRTAVVDRTSPIHGRWLSLAFAPHGRRIVTGSIDSTVGVWDAHSGGPPLTTFQWGVGPAYAVTFDHEGLRAAAAGHSGVIVWDVDE